MQHRSLLAASLALTLLSLGCDDGGSPGGSGGVGGDGAASTTSSSSGGAGGGTGAAGGDGGAPTTTGTGGSSTETTSTGGASPTFVGRCGDAVPAGATEAAPLPTYTGTCPTLTAGLNTIASGGADREFILVVPATYDANKSYPVFFLWHWLGGSADDFLERAEVQAASDSQEFIAIIPEKKGDLTFVWPYDATVSQSRIDEELGFFEDMLACVGAEFSVDRNCVSSVGVSAGALFTDQLAHFRSTHLSSFVSLSGGTGGFAIKPWGTADHKLPGLVLWGGPSDTCQGILSFEDLSGDLEQHLTQDGHFVVECIHNCGHSEPPFEAPAGFSKYKGMWDFILDHPYWVSDGDSIYQTEGLSPDAPEWCAIGAGNATPREGECVNQSEC